MPFSVQGGVKNAIWLYGGLGNAIFVWGRGLENWRNFPPSPFLNGIDLRHKNILFPVGGSNFGHFLYMGKKIKTPCYAVIWCFSRFGEFC